MRKERPSPEQVQAARDRAFEAVEEWLDLATSAGQSLMSIMRDLQKMIKREGS